MRDEQVGEVELVLEILEQVDDLGLDGHVEGGNRLVSHDEVRVERERTRQTDPLALPPGEFVRVAVGGVSRQPHDVEQFADPLFRAAAVG